MTAATSASRRAPSELAESGAQHRPYRGSERRLASLRGPSSKQLDDEEWVALGLAQSRARSGSILRIAEPSSERRRRGFVEPVEGMVMALSWPRASTSPTRG